ncbi:hypothetical protein TNCV_5018461 [Trichonephila clavipes]|nr:hypothetical protein TNCV_5018461 [Trichonephila clavipes]
MRSKNVPISGPFVIKKDLQFTKVLGYDQFLRSIGWLEKGRNDRYGHTNRHKRHSESKRRRLHGEDKQRRKSRCFKGYCLFLEARKSRYGIKLWIIADPWNGSIHLEEKSSSAPSSKKKTEKESNSEDREGYQKGPRQPTSPSYDSLGPPFKLPFKPLSRL